MLFGCRHLITKQIDVIFSLKLGGPLVPLLNVSIYYLVVI